MRRYYLTVSTDVEVMVDETKFDAEFQKEFGEAIDPSIKTVEQHVRFLAEHLTGFSGSDFIEGYGPAEDMGIKVTIGSSGADIDSMEQL